MGAVRELADRYVDAYVALDPVTATDLGLTGHDHELTDYSPEGEAARSELLRQTLAELDALDHASADDADRRCARLLRERIDAQLALADSHEPERLLNNLASPLQALKDTFDLTPSGTPEEWEVFGQRLEAVPAAYAAYGRQLAVGAANGRFAAPRQVAVGAEQLAVWSGQTGLVPYFVERLDGAPDDLRPRLERAAAGANDALVELRRFLVERYGPDAEGTPDAVGPERYARWARLYNGVDLDLADAYEYGWSEFLRIDAEMQVEADRVLSGATPLEAMRHLDEHGQALEGTDHAVTWLQALMDQAIDALHPTHFDLEGPLRQVEARIAPAGGAAAPYYTSPSEDFSRPGATWLPTMGRDRFPTWELVSTWYHEGLPGHHLQLAQWLVVAPQLSRFQTTLGMISANVEGWALYAERLMDELGFFEDPGDRLGFLVAQQLRSIRVVIDIGMHNELVIPKGQPFHPGERWTPALGHEFLFASGGSDLPFLESEHVRYLGVPGQAIGYKLGERVWLAGREDARRRAGDAFDLKAWHMAALGLGSLGLDDLRPELAAL